MKLTWTEKLVSASIVFIGLGVIAFWLTLAYVAIHYIAKYW